MATQHLPPYLAYLPEADHGTVTALHLEKQAWISQEKKGFLRYRKALRTVAGLRASSCDFSSSVVRIGTREEISQREFEEIHGILRGLMPWRKGPFQVFGVDIDSEWQSNRKWDRLLPVLPDLDKAVIADIGSNNGYYMFRMAAQRPALVLGFEPYVHHYFTFQILNSLAGQTNLHSDLLGVEHLALFPCCFDVIFLLGILYHRHSPLDTLRDVFTALKPGGTLLVESQAIPGDEPVALFPEKTYAKAPGTWFVPTGACLNHWLTRCGFTGVTCFDAHPMNSTEQRRTAWMNYESYQDFIDKEDPARTIEGYPAPWRVYLSAKKPRSQRQAGKAPDTQQR